ncbi:MAG: hypothetical protein ACP5M0_06370 [Desulfomonilaceae bacterium]
MNLCHPDATKSCAACCGLYNAAAGTREILRDRLAVRTSLFRGVIRSPDAIQAFEQDIIAREGTESVDPDIHVCRFVGFLDPFCRTVGCLLHPSAPGNDGKDLRGLCYYGSLACKTFFCDAWQAIPARHQAILADLIHDWHLWGLVATDVDYVLSLFGRLESAIRAPLDPSVLDNSQARHVLIKMLRWKNDWPLAHGSQRRASRYYCHPSADFLNASRDEQLHAMAQCLDATFGVQIPFRAAASAIESAVQAFAALYECR